MDVEECGGRRRDSEYIRSDIRLTLILVPPFTDFSNEDAIVSEKERGPGYLMVLCGALVKLRWSRVRRPVRVREHRDAQRKLVGRDCLVLRYK